MNRSLFLLAFIVLMVACRPKDQSNTSDNNIVSGPIKAGQVDFTGIITGIDSGILELVHQEDLLIKTDTLKLAGGKFSFTTSLKEPTQYSLKLANSEEMRPLYFYADPGSVTIRGSIDSLYKAEVKGGGVQDEFKKVTDEINGIYQKAEPFYKKLSDARNSGDVVTATGIQAIFDSLSKAATQYTLDYAASHSASIVAATMVSVNNSESKLEELTKLYDNFSSSVKNTQPGRNLKTIIDSRKNAATGANAVDFTQNDVNGKPVSLSSYKGKYLLVDFWASWCGPCRGENPNVVIAYNKFKSKGFDILGVSLDDSKEKWLQAIAADHLTWTHVSDLKGWGNAAARLYRIESIPANFLLDKEGKIIAKDLRGEELQQQLQNLMP